MCFIHRFVGVESYLFGHGIMHPNALTATNVVHVQYIQHFSDPEKGKTEHRTTSAQSATSMLKAVLRSVGIEQCLAADDWMRTVVGTSSMMRYSYDVVHLNIKKAEGISSSYSSSIE
jgi:hypothetical protein